MKKRSLLLTFFTYSLVCGAQTNQIKIVTDNKLKTELDSLVDQSVSAFMKDNSRVGLSIGIIKNGKPFIKP